MNNSDSLASHTAAGHRLANAAFIDAHYAVCRTMYEAMLRAVGIQPGWHVLDAGCGSGSFLPLIAELVGPGGAITAFDLDPENVARVEALRTRLDVPVDVQIGNATNLQYPDNTFDAIWSANVIQYLKGDELAQMLRECVRVLKPGGIVAIKESDTTTLQMYPLDRFVFWRYLEQLAQAQPGILNSLNLKPWMRDAGLADVSQATYIEAIHAPLDEITQMFVTSALRFFADDAQRMSLPEADKEYWRRCSEPGSPESPVSHPDYYFREGCTLALGRKAAVSRA